VQLDMHLHALRVDAVLAGKERSLRRLVWLAKTKETCGVLLREHLTIDYSRVHFGSLNSSTARPIRPPSQPFVPA